MKIKIIILLLLTALLVLPLAGACAREQAPAPRQLPAAKKGDIIIGILDDLSGPMSGICGPAVDGEKDGIRYLNDEQSGIRGSQIQAIVFDHKGDPALMASGWERLKTEHVPVVLSYLGGIPALEALCQRDHIPIIGSTGTLDQLFPKDPSSYYYAQAPYLPGVTPSVSKLIEKDWAKKRKSGGPKIAVDVGSVDYERKVLTKAAALEMKRRGWDYMTISTPSTSPDVVTQALQVKQFGADYLFLPSSDDSPAVAWLKELDKQNLHPAIFSSPGLGSPEVWNAVGKLAAGTTAYMYSPQWSDTNVPLISKLHELNAKWHPEVKSRPSYYTHGFVGSIIVSKGLGWVYSLSFDGYDRLRGEGGGKLVKDALDTVWEFVPMEMGIGYSYSTTDHQGLHGIIWYTWTADGTMVRAGDWDVFPPLPEEQKTDAWWLQ